MKRQPWMEYAGPEKIHWADIEMRADVRRPGFWEQHGRNKQDYLDMARQIPEVQMRLDKGESLENIKKDPELHSTATYYFDPEHAIRLDRTEDGYSFDGDGRHRIAAAEEVHVEIPARINGEYVRSHDQRATEKSEQERKEEMGFETAPNSFNQESSGGQQELTGWEDMHLYDPRRIVQENIAQTDAQLESRAQNTSMQMQETKTVSMGMEGDSNSFFTGQPPASNQEIPAQPERDATLSRGVHPFAPEMIVTHDPMEKAEKHGYYGQVAHELDSPTPYSQER